MKYSKFTRKISARVLALMIMCIMAVLSLSGCASSSGGQTQEEATAVSEQTTAEAVQEVSGETVAEDAAETEASGEEQTSTSDVLKVQVLKVGKADAMVLTCGGQTMVIDCGEEEDGQ